MNVNVAASICLVIGLYSAWKSGAIFLQAKQQQHHSQLTKLPPPATLLLTLIIAVPTTLQFFFPAVLTALRRDYTQFASGEWWRLVTPLFVQDAGIAGSIFNLISLVLVGAVAEQLWGRWRMLVIFFVGGVTSEVIAFSWQPIGAGNSVSNFSLAASIAVGCLMLQPNRPVQIAALIALTADVLLLTMKDIHGAAAIAGMLLALCLYRGRFITNRP
jgi:membrane associated rhomboid family serine protease